MTSKRTSTKQPTRGSAVPTEAGTRQLESRMLRGPQRNVPLGILGRQKPLGMYWTD